MHYAVTPLCKECPSELEYLSFYSPDRTQKYSNDGNISPSWSEEFFGDGEDNIGIIILNFSITEHRESDRDEYEEEDDQENHRPECCSAWGLVGVLSLLTEIHRHVPAVVEEYRNERTTCKKCRREFKR